MPLPESSTAAAVMQTNTEHSAAGNRLAAEKTPAVDSPSPVGASPTRSFANLWSGAALTSSLKQAISDHLAQPTDSARAAAEPHPTEAAHQQAAFAVTADTNPPAALASTHGVPNAAFLEVTVQSSPVRRGGNNVKKAAVDVKKSSRQHRGPSSRDVATQGTTAGAALGAGAVAADRPPGRADPVSGAVLAHNKGDASADRGRSGASTAGRVPGSSRQNGRTARQLEIRMIPAGPELVDVEYPLYHKYQVSNHHDEPSKVCCICYITYDRYIHRTYNIHIPLIPLKVCSSGWFTPIAFSASISV